jgi:hypothetical protein
MLTTNQPSPRETLHEIIGTLIDRCELCENTTGVAQIGLPLSDSPAQRFRDLAHPDVAAAIAIFAWRAHQFAPTGAQIKSVIKVLTGQAHLNGGQDATLADALNEHPLLDALNYLLHSEEGGETYEDSATIILERLEDIGHRYRLDTKHRLWPRTASYLSRRLRELDDETWLRQIGYEYVNGQLPENRKPTGRKVVLRRLDDCTREVPST